MSEISKDKREYILRLYSDFKMRATAVTGSSRHTASFYKPVTMTSKRVHGLITTTAKGTEVNVTRDEIVIHRRPLFCRVRTPHYLLYPI